MSRLWTLAMAGAILALLGCAQLKYEDFSKIENGMTRAQVRNIMGSAHLREAYDYFYYEDGERRAEISFEDDEVVDAGWTGPKNGE